MTKIKLLFVFFLIIFIFVIIKLFYIQVINPSPTDSSSYLQTRKIRSQRGKIFDRFGQPLAIGKTTYKLFAEPKKIDDRFQIARKINQILQIGDTTIAAKIDPQKDWVAIKRGIELPVKEQIENLKIPGIGFDPEYSRFYPEASLSAHLLGFVGKNSGGEDIGYFGIEGFYDKDLAGLPGVIKSERDILGKPIFIGIQQLFDPENGRDIYMTIDKSVAGIVKRKLKAGLESYQAKQGCVIVANPKNMEILALTCLPDFDPQNYYQSTEDIFKNPAISSLFEPGSVFKPLVVAAAIEEKKIKPDDFYDETGPQQIGQYSIKTWDNKYEGRISTTRILEKSSNVGMVWVGKKLGNDQLYNYVNKFGFGKLTGIDLQGEVAGSIKPINNWYSIDFATATFGQGISVTPIQMITAFAAVINGGKLFTPYVVHKSSAAGNERKMQPTLITRAISENTSKILVKMLVSTVEKGEVKWAKPKGYTVGGKTGTAQIPIAGHYDPSKTIASFIGFAPANDPAFIIMVSLREPKTSPWGSETAAPIFFEIAKELLVYYNIAPQ